jgi:DNA-binding XRE family transcriptional regulator
MVNIHDISGSLACDPIQSCATLWRWLLKQTNIDEVLKSIGGRIKSHRVRCKLTQEALAETALISPKHLSDCELGKYNVSVAYLCKIADALNLSYLDLLIDDE